MRECGCDIAVIGAGPAGLAAAAAAKKQGAGRVIMIERDRLPEESSSSVSMPGSDFPTLMRN